MRSERTSWMRWLGFERGAPAGSRALAANEVVRLPRGGSVHVEAGQVWITREGDPTDHVLEAGGRLELAARGRAVAWALAPSRIALGTRSESQLPVPARTQRERGGRSNVQLEREAREASPVPSPLRQAQ